MLGGNDVDLYDLCDSGCRWCHRRTIRFGLSDDGVYAENGCLDAGIGANISVHRGLVFGIYRIYPVNVAATWTGG